MSPTITSDGLVDGFDNASLTTTIFIAVGIAFILKLSYLQVSDYVLWMREEQRQRIAEEVAREASLTDVRRLVETRLEDDCPICYDTLTLPIETNCRHVFCARCIILCWETTESRGGGSTTLSILKCPLCRGDVSNLIPRFTDAPEEVLQSQQDKDAEKRYISETKTKINDYNRRFSGTRRNFKDYITDIPLMLYHMWTEATGQSGLLMFCQVQVVMALLACFIYIVSPFDIIPESAFGIVGLIDDVLIVITILVYLSFLFRSVVLEQDIE